MATASSLLTRLELPDGAVLLRSEHGELAYLQRGPLVFFADAGTLDQPLAEAFVTVLENARKSNEVPVLLANAMALQGFSSEAREVFSDWGRKQGKNVTAVVLVRSKVVRMVATVIGMLGGGRIEFHDTEASFDAAVARVLPPNLKAPHLERYLTPRR